MWRRYACEAMEHLCGWETLVCHYDIIVLICDSHSANWISMWNVDRVNVNVWTNLVIVWMCGWGWVIPQESRQQVVDGKVFFYAVELFLTENFIFTLFFCIPLQILWLSLHARSSGTFESKNSFCFQVGGLNFFWCHFRSRCRFVAR